MTPTAPIYVAGLERTGTSLIFALLSSHPNIAMTRRTNLWTYFFDQYGDLADDANLDRCLDMMMRYKRLAILEPDAGRLRSDFLTGERTYGRLFDLLERQHAERIGKPRWGDKSLNTERYADAIFDAYPEARIIHMVRDPRDRYASVETRWKVRRGGVGAGTAEWLSSIGLAQRNLTAHPGRYLILPYERLASSPELCLREVCAFIGEAYSPEMLSMEGAASFRDQGSNSSYGSRQAGVISTDSIGRFRHVLTPSQISFIDRTAGAAMASLGYPDESPEMDFTQSLKFGAIEFPVEKVRFWGWQIKHAIANHRGRPLPAYRLVAGEAKT